MAAVIVMEGRRKNQLFHQEKRYKMTSFRYDLIRYDTIAVDMTLYEVISRKGNVSINMIICIIT